MNLRIKRYQISLIKLDLNYLKFGVGIHQWVYQELIINIYHFKIKKMM